MRVVGSPSNNGSELPLHPTRVYPSWASIFVEVGYIRLRWGEGWGEGVRPIDKSKPLTRIATAMQSDLSLRERLECSSAPLQLNNIQGKPSHGLRGAGTFTSQRARLQEEA